MTNSPEDWAERTGREVRPPETNDGVGEDGRAAPPRVPFTGSQSLLEMHRAAPHKVPCADCARRDSTIENRVSEIKSLRIQIADLEERLQEQAKVQEMYSPTAEAMALRQTIRDLQARDEIQRIDLDETYKLAWALTDKGLAIYPWGGTEEP